MSLGQALDFNTAARNLNPTPQDNDRRLEDLRRALRLQTPSLVRELFPLARIHVDEARIGDAQGARGESMSIVLSGEKAGQWKDHNPTAREPDGDLITLWRNGQGYGDTAAGFWRAVEDLEIHLGMSAKPRSLGVVVRVASDRAKTPKPAEPEKVAELRHVYTSADGQTVLAQVVRREFSDGSKRFLQINAAGEFKSPEVRPLYNLPAVAASPWVVLVEGEKKADALKAQGVPVTSLMGGAGTLLEKTDLEPLRGKQVVLWRDNDDAGSGFMTVLGPRLAAMGCDVRQVDIPTDAPPKWDAFNAVAEGRDVLAMINAARVDLAPMAAPGAPALVIDRSIRFLSIGELLSAKPPLWLVKGVIPERSFCSIIGPPGGFKSFVALDLAMHVAHGRDWRGHRIREPGGVVYVAGEGQAGVAPRVHGWVQGKDGDESVPFVTVPQAVAMPTDQLEELIAGIASLPFRPALIILDTLARCFGAGDENSATDMGAFVAACDRLKCATGAAVLVVHHTGKDADKGGRGSSALLGALDCQMTVKRRRHRLTVCNTKQKDASEFEDVSLAADEVTLRGVVDEDGEPVTTLVLIRDDGLIAANDDGDHDAPEGRLTPNEQKVLDKLGQAALQGHPGLGFTSLAGATGINKGNLSPILSGLVARGSIEAEPNGRGRIWRLAP